MKSNIAKKLLLGIILISSVTYANNPIKKDSIKSNECLVVIGIALDEKNEPIDGVNIKLYKENEETVWAEGTIVVYHDHNFKFVLDANEYYTIEISKPGYVKRLVSISTKLPSNVSIRPLFKYEFDIVLFKDREGVDDYYLDFPVALISYHAKTAIFDNNNKYTKHIKRKIKESLQVAKF